MSRYGKDEGIVLAKKNLLKGKRLVILFTRDHGKIVLTAYGVRTFTSRRLSHLETGNYIRLSFYKKNSYFYLSETELIYAYSKIKKSGKKLSLLFLFLTVLSKILPENQPEHKLFSITEEALKKMNNMNDFTLTSLIPYITLCLQKSGFVNEEQTKDPLFDPLAFIEDLIGKKLTIYSGF